ncbi:MFS transporter [Streptomyces sp. NPDC087856]|uniref:MFS transporter n=1 Tax=Streptomyces sp. NPDC087856 TaxID=3365811 RepID=UPI0038299186
MSASTSSAPPTSRTDETPGGSQVNVLMWSMGAGFAALYTAYAGLVVVLLPAQIEHLDAAAKESNLALVTMTSSIVTLFAQPIIGALSDRTRGRLGRRTPWMLFGAVGSTLSLLAISHATTLLWLTLMWVTVQVLLNVVQAPITAVMADRVAPRRFGIVSAFVGLGSNLGATLGVIVAARYAGQLGLGYGVIAAIVLVTVLAFVLLNRDRTRPEPPEPFSWREFLTGFWVSPRQHPDFAWAFVARMTFILGYWGVSTYQRYALQDYVGLDSDAVDSAQQLMSVLALVGTLAAAIPAAKISDRTGRRKIFVVGASVLLALSMAIPLVSPTLPAMYAYALVSGMGFGTYMSLDMALMTEVLPKGAAAGKDLGILNIATNVPQALGPIIASVLITSFAAGSDKLPGYRVLFVFAMAVVLVSALAIRPIKGVK